MTTPDYENMTDEEIAALDAPVGLVLGGASAEAEEHQDAGQDGSALDDDAAGDDVADADLDEAEGHHTTPKQPEANPSEEDGEAGEDAGGPDAPAQVAAEDEEKPVDYKALYEEMMAPFKANGREFAPESPAEVKRLAQMGAHFTKKMQSLAPGLKVLKMLENNQLMDEAQVSFLIDLARKDKGAIQKLLSEAEIDPFDLNTEEAASYTPGNHTVSDQDMAFTEVVNEVVATSTGSETIRWINDAWDTQSKDLVYREPGVLSLLNEHRANGIAGRINSEIERRKTLGELQGMPFLQAYKLVGDDLNSRGAFADVAASAPQPNQPAPVKQPQVIGQRVAAPKASESNGQAARAASPTRSAAKTPAPEFDVFQLSDAEIAAMSSPPKGSFR